MKRRRAGLLLAMLLSLSPLAQARDEDPSAQKFDALYAQITGPASLDAPPNTANANLERLRTLLPSGDKVRDARMRSVYCLSTYWADTKQALAYTDEALRRAQAVKDQQAQGRAMICRIAHVLGLQGPKQALVEADRAVALVEKAQEPQLLGEILMYRGSLLSQLGDQAKALVDYQRARSAFRDAGINHEVDALLVRLAIVYRRIGDWSHAESYLNQLTTRLESKRDWPRMVGALIQLGYLHDEAGAPDKAQAAFERAIAVATRQGDDFSAASARLGLALVQVSQGRHDAALAMLKQARAYYTETGNNQDEGRLLLLTGMALAGKNQHQQALSLFHQALPPIQNDGNERYLATLYRSQAASEEALGLNAQALASFKRYSELQASLQRKMQLEQNRLLAYEHEARTREMENDKLRADAETQRQRVASLQRVRGWQRLALLLGLLLIALMSMLAWRQHRNSRRLRMLAMTDPLTGAASRITTETTTDLALARVARNHTALSVLMLDLDHFKAINDRYGHAAGDTVLRAVANAWKTQLREYDLLGRIGGEEFVVVCSDAPLTLAHSIAKRLLQATRAVRLPEIDPELHITASIGIAEAQPGDTRETLLARADAALYRAKSQGRDRAES
ncbi:MAG: diguanylate cyclase [Thermomonas sp.]|uniref:diguanylate cyclase n=1 Tax=Thermomonas sp. TaxID=1971895 RepID=UPI0039E65426